MTLEQVIQAGEAFKEPHFTPYAACIGVLIVVVLCMTLWAKAVDSPTLSFPVITGGLSIVLVVVLTWVYTEKTDMYNEKVTHWEEEQVIPYIKSLPIDSREVVSINEELTLESPSPIRTVEYLEGGVTKSYKGVFELVYDLDEGSPSSAHFIFNRTDFGHGIGDSQYLFEVHLSKDSKED